jgi:hypothetical protein
MDTRGEYLKHEVEHAPPFSAVFRGVLKAEWGKTTINFIMSSCMEQLCFQHIYVYEILY